MFQDHAACMQYALYIYIRMFKQCFIVLGFKDAHFSNYSTFQQETCLPQRVLFSQYGLLSWKISRYYSEKWCAILKNTFYMFASTMCSPVKNTYITHIVTRALHAQEGLFDIEVDMAYSNRMLYLLKKMHLLEGALTSKRRITPFKGII